MTRSKRKTRNSKLLPDLVRGATIHLAELDPLLETTPEDFEARLETLVEELDRADVRIVQGEPLGSTSKRPLRGHRDPYTAQVTSLPQLDREAEATLARRYALVKRRFTRALEMMEVDVKAENMTEYLCREYHNCASCKSKECRTWCEDLGPRAGAMLQQRCREFHAVRNTFIEGSLYIVVLALNNIHFMSIPREDLLQEGNASLFRAVDKYDWRKGVRFRTYAEYWVNQSFMEAIYNQSRTVRVPAWVHKTTRKIRKARERARLTADGEVNEAAVAKGLGLEPERVNEILQDNRYSYSMENAVTGGDEERGSSLADCLPGQDDTPAEAMARETAELLPRRVEAALSTLAGREREVIMARFGIGGAPIRTLSEMGQHLGVSAERVRQIQEAALAKLRGRSEELQLDAL